MNAVQVFGDINSKFEAWERTDFLPFTSNYAPDDLASKVNDVAVKILESIKAAEEIKHYFSQYSFPDFCLTVREQNDKKHGVDTKALIQNATELQQYFIVKAAEEVVKARPAMEKTEVLGITVLFGIHAAVSASQQMNNTPVSRTPIEQQKHEALQKLIAMRSQFHAGHPFLEQVDAMIKQTKAELNINN